VVKLGASDRVVRINRDAGGSQVVVVLPEALNNLAAGNLMLVVTDLLPSLGESFGSKKGAGDVILLTSPVLEISFAQEAQGEVSVLEVNGLSDPIVFKISDQLPVAGDECVFFDPLEDRWSTEGAQLLTDMALDPGTWCAVSHTSIFAVAQTVPFGSALELAEANGYVPAALLVLATCCLTVPALCTFLGRRVKAPSTGRAYLAYNGRSRPITFSMTKVVSEKEGGGTDDKVLVKWDVTPDVLPDLDNLKLRHVSTEIGGKGREVIRVKSSKSDADLSARSARSAERSFSVRCNYSDTSSLVDQEDSIEECDIDDLLQPLPTLPAKAEAYEDGQMVLYWSQSLGQSAAAVIVSKGTFFSDDNGEAWPLYDCRVGRLQQLRCEVPLCSLRPAPRSGEKLDVQISGKWLPARFLASLFFLEVCRVALEAPSEAGELQVPFRRLRRRFSKGQICEVYGQDGWVNACIEEDKVDRFDARELVEEVLVSSGKTQRVPFSLVRASPALVDM